MSIWSKLLVTAITTAAAAGAVYFLKKREEDDAYDLDEFDEDFDETDTFEDEEAAAEEEAPAAEEAVEEEEHGGGMWTVTVPRGFPAPGRGVPAGAGSRRQRRRGAGRHGARIRQDTDRL